jgi:hypothetical protein
VVAEAGAARRFIDDFECLLRQALLASRPGYAASPVLGQRRRDGPASGEHDGLAALPAPPRLFQSALP